MFERPTKNDLDRSLSSLMHEHRQKLIAECNHIKSGAAKAGTLLGTSVIVMAVTAADELHKDAMTQANAILLDFIERMERPAAEVVSWARPHLENLGNSLLGVVPPNNFPQDHQRLTHQYRAVFQQRLDGALRDVEIGFAKGAGFARAEKVESNKEEWISAAEAVKLLKPALKGSYSAQMRICARAHAGLIHARADRFMMDKRSEDNFDIPKEFWWAEGNQALKQDWEAGDFDTWLNREHHLRAFGVSFLRADIEKMIPATVAEPTSPSSPAPTAGGRPPADWWEDLLIDLCFKHFHGDLPHQKQADIVRAMQDWITAHGYDASDSTIKLRARKLADAIKRDDAAEN
jgi:hypothetical protein